MKTLISYNRFRGLNLCKKKFSKFMFLYVIQFFILNFEWYITL